MKRLIDLNADLGEGFQNDRILMNYISSANIACGIHAGSPELMSETVKLALQHSVTIGAHPGYADRDGFGRVDIYPGFENLVSLVVYQLGALESVCKIHGAEMVFVKPHGALYNRAARDYETAMAVAEAIKKSRPGLSLVGPGGSELARAAAENALKFVAEVFADRGYNTDGSLVKRGEKGAIISEREECLQRVLRMITEGKVIAVNGQEIELDADTVCLHGDNEKAVEFARFLAAGLKSNNIEIASCHG